MKKFTIISAFIWAFAVSLSFAEVRPMNYGTRMPGPKNLQSSAVYYTTSSCSNGVIYVSTREALLYSVIASSGEGDPSVRIYDSRVSTQGIPDTFQVRAATGIARIILPRTITSVDKQWTFEVGASSGIAVWNEAVTRAGCVTCIYSEW